MEMSCNYIKIETWKTSTEYKVVQTDAIGNVEKLLIDRLQLIIEKDQLIPQFGFTQEYVTIAQIHRVVEKIRQDLEDKKFCAAAFLDISQMFDKVWYIGVLYNLEKHYVLCMIERSEVKCWQKLCL